MSKTEVRELASCDWNIPTILNEMGELAELSREYSRRRWLEHSLQSSGFFFVPYIYILYHTF